MNFFLDDNIEKLNDLRGRYPDQVFIPLNAGRTVGPRMENLNIYMQERPADQVELGEWINYQITQGNIIIGNVGVNRVITGNESYIANDNEALIVLNDINAIGYTYTLPASPANNTLIKFMVLENGGGWTIARNGENINGVAIDYDMNNSGQRVTFEYVTGVGWITT